MDSLSDSEEKEEYMSANEELSSDNDDYQPVDELIQGLDYVAIGGNFEIDPNKLTIIKAIGKGHFSDVHIGILSLPIGNITVAVKTVKTSQMKTGSMNAEENEKIHKQREALRHELSIFTHLQSSSAGGHENVLKLFGAITTIRTDFSLLTEHCEYGSMDCFLQEKRKNGDFLNELIFEANGKEVWKIQCDSSWGENFQYRRENGVITTSDLLWFALQIARGMQYLASMNVLHRDIAARNVLLKPDFTVKIADYGLSKILKESDDEYYMMNKETALPIRYIAPESLKFRRFSITTEYWSFGVVIWELFTFAEKKPYFVEFKNYESSTQLHKFLIEHLSTGCRLSIPNKVPQQIKSLLSRLWDSDPERRPSFQECETVIGQELMQSCPYEKFYMELPPEQQNRNERSTMAVSANALALLSRVQKSLKDMYLQRFRNTNPFSLPFTFNIENTWVSLEIQEYMEVDEDIEEDSEMERSDDTDEEDIAEEKEKNYKPFHEPQDHAELLKNAFVKEKMLIIEGKPAMGKTSLMRRLAYEWAKGKQELSHFDLIIYAEFREVREHEFESIADLVIDFNKNYKNFIGNEEFEYLKLFLKNKRYYGQTLLLLDGYDESSLDKQCTELSAYFTSSTLENPLLFNIVITTRPGYLSMFRERKGRFIFAEVLGFIANEQKRKYISNHFSSKKKSDEKTEAVHALLNSNRNLNKLAKTPLFLTFICLVHEKIIDGTIVELYCNIIRWLIDRHQQDYPDRNVPTLFQYQDTSTNATPELSEAQKKQRIIQDKYLEFPQLLCLGKMAYHYLKNDVFQESHINQFNLTLILQQVGLLRKEEHYDQSLNLRTTFAFSHRTIQEFLAACFCFCSDEQLDEWIKRVKKLNTRSNSEFEKFLLRIALSKKISLNEGKRNLYFETIRQMDLDLTFDSFLTATGMNCELLNWFLSQCTNVQTIQFKGPLQSIRHITSMENTLGYNDSRSTSKVARVAFLSFENFVYLHSLTFRSCTFDVNSQLSITNCLSLKNIECNRCKINRFTALHIASLPNIDSLDFKNCTFEANTQLSFKNCPSLKKLRFETCKIKSSAILGIISLPAIDSLILNGCTFETKYQLSFTNCSSLKNIEFTRCEIKSNAILDIATLPEVDDFKLSYSTFEANSKLLFINCPAMKNWEFYYCIIENGTTLHITSFLFINDMKFSCCAFKANCQLSFKNCHILKNLEFDVCQFKSSTSLGFAALPAIETFSFKKCTFEVNSQLSFPNCPSMKYLKFNECEIKNSIKLSLAIFPGIEVLSFEKCTFEVNSQLSFTDYSSLENHEFIWKETESKTTLGISTMSAFDTVEFYKCKIDLASSHSIAYQIRNSLIKFLKLTFGDDCNKEFLIHLQECNNVEKMEIAVRDYKIRQNDVLSFSDLIKLHSLTFGGDADGGCELEANSQLSFTNCTWLKNRKFSNCTFEANSQLSVTNCPSLKNLKFTYCDMKSSTNFGFATLLAIETVQFKQCAFSANSQLSFTNCPSLKNLQFHACEMERSTIVGIATLPAIHTVEFAECKIDIATWQSITDQIINSNVKYLKLTFGYDFNKEFLIHLQTCNNIGEMEITIRRYAIRQNDLLSISDLIKLHSLTFGGDPHGECVLEASSQLSFTDCPSLKNLEFSNCTFGASSQLSITNCPSLKNLKFTYCKIKSSRNFGFATLPAIDTVQFKQCTFSANSQLSFTNCSSLKNLKFHACKMERSTIVGIATLPAIETVQFDQCEIDIATWQSITGQISNSTVKYLHLPANFFVEVFCPAFLHHLQKCERIQQITVKEYGYILKNYEESVTANLVLTAQKLPALTSITISGQDRGRLDNWERLSERNQQRIEEAGQQRNPMFSIKYVGELDE